jgi:hypothetical protein
MHAPIWWLLAQAAPPGSKGASAHVQQILFFMCEMGVQRLPESPASPEGPTSQALIGKEMRYLVWDTILDHGSTDGQELEQSRQETGTPSACGDTHVGFHWSSQGPAF